MLSSTLVLTTTDAERIIKRLSNHWRHKMTVTTDENGKTSFTFSENDIAIMHADQQHLYVSLTNEEATTQSKLQQVILSHINRMAGVEFTAEWN